MKREELRIITVASLGPLIGASFRRLAPDILIRNPVMFVVGVGFVLTSVFTIGQMATGSPWGFDLAITGTLLFTVLFANAAEALAEARGREAW